MRARERSIRRIQLDAIDASGGPRATDAEAVNRLAASIAKIGMHTPITLEGAGTDAAGTMLYRVVSGRHRVAAARQLGWVDIEAFQFESNPAFDGFDGDEDFDALAEMWAISENLHRAELTALERDEQIARWIELEKRAPGISAHNGPKRGRPIGGVNAAARDLGIKRTDAQRAMQVAGLSPEAKETAKVVGLDDHRNALLAAAKQDTPEAQVSYLKSRATKRVRVADEPLNEEEACEKQVAALMSAWNKASAEAREQFLGRIDRPVMDRRFA